MFFASLGAESLQKGGGGAAEGRRQCGLEPLELSHRLVIRIVHRHWSREGGSGILGEGARM